jgi:hypothetical protein
MLVDTWTDGYLVLRHRAFDARGAVELDTGERWPRTTGEDVVAIAALFDPAMRRHATPGARHRWRGALDQLERTAMRTPHAVYADNRAFWSTLEFAAVFLDDQAVSVPGEALWQALVDQLDVVQPRNVGPKGDGPFQHFDTVKTYDDLYIAEFKYLRDLRGFDRTALVAGGAEKSIPRTTNADVIALATYWDARLSDAQRIMGRADVDAAWKPAMEDVEKLAKPGKPDDVYPKNDPFWRALVDVAVHVAVADEAPTRWDLMIESVKESAAHLPQTLGKVASKGAELISDAAHAVGKVAGEAGKGLFEGVGTPVLIGVGLVGLYFITRSRRGSEEA